MEIESDSYKGEYMLNKESCNWWHGLSAAIKLGSLEKTIIASLFHSGLHSAVLFSQKNHNTLEYWINVQQILFKFWVLAHLHAYFVLHNSTEKNVVQNSFFTTYLLPTRLFGLHVYLVP